LNPIVHAELSWLSAQRLPDRRDRILITIAGIAPDVDGLSLLAGEDAYGKYHHLLTHGLISALVTAGVCAALARKKAAVLLMAFAAFHLHLLCDLAGSGPGWPIFYFWPLNRTELFWDGQWELASWQNSTIGMLATLLCLACALKFRRTFVELFSLGADAKVVQTIRARFGR
jgi:inner membrane protein